ncbi:ThuA domain-containing protein [Actinoallomurus sp. NPDC052308]|uniref:ThuA domain-containing protein n=1 Tax=Actinoallomurus sp. NPDC052308 TaxID=3155530 RepID=UPI00341B1360
MTPSTDKTALVVRGGWDGHFPVEASDRYAKVLEREGYDVTTSETLDSYLDADLLRNTDLIVQCWTMGTITGEQVAGLSAAVRAGTGFAGWHGGVIDAFRDSTAYQLITGGQFVHHPRGFVEYEVRPVPGKEEHPVTAGLEAFTVCTEQYYVHTDPTIDVLAVTDFVDDPDLPGAAGTTVPVAWTRRWGAGRVFVTTLGHAPADLEVRQTHAMVTRGLTWATR